MAQVSLTAPEGNTRKFRCARRVLIGLFLTAVPAVDQALGFSGLEQLLCLATAQGGRLGVAIDLGGGPWGVADEPRNKRFDRDWRLLVRGFAPSFQRAARPAAFARLAFQRRR